ncbi:hypothetical protein [Nocardia farcinica]|uniref:hypothetical protein n=1 Tax=Nocardia farcinica TaxID=37329 RepID=UPI0037B15DC0
MAVLAQPAAGLVAVLQVHTGVPHHGRDGVGILVAVAVAGEHPPCVRQSGGGERTRPAIVTVVVVEQRQDSWVEAADGRQ